MCGRRQLNGFKVLIHLSLLSFLSEALVLQLVIRSSSYSVQFKLMDIQKIPQRAVTQ